MAPRRVTVSAPRPVPGILLRVIDDQRFVDTLHGIGPGRRLDVHASRCEMNGDEGRACTCRPVTLRVGAEA